jgi:four helix bundle protein
MSQESLEKFPAYAIADRLFDSVVADMEPLANTPACWRLIGQQIAAADSICANIEEGYGREGTRELIHYLAIARGSCREVRGRYHSMRHGLSTDVVANRQSLCDEVISILVRTIPRLRHKLATQAPRSIS